MIGQIGPLVKAGMWRQITIPHCVGGLVGGAIAGLYAGLVALLVISIGGVSAPMASTGLVILVVAASLLDLANVTERLPGLGRQTPGLWSCTLGTSGAATAWGFDLGMGVTTRLPGLGLVFLLAAAAFHSPLASVLAAASFGLVRSSFVVAAAVAPGDIGARTTTLARSAGLVRRGAALIGIVVFVSVLLP